LRSLNVLDETSDGVRLCSTATGCALLEQNLCTAYELRPQACREYPWYNVGGKLYYDAGCPGMQLGVEGRPNVASITPAEHYYRMFPGPIRAVVLRVLRLW
jgi:Fe-S-cluster containining protein